MTSDEIKKTIEFILSEQARVTTGLEQVTDNTRQLQRMTLSLTELFNRERKDLRAKLTALTDAQIRAEAEGREFRASVGQVMTMLESSQDKLAAAMIETQRSQTVLEKSQDKIATAIIELQQGQRELQQGQRQLQVGQQDLQQGQAAMQQALAEMAQAVVSAHQRIDGIGQNGKKS